MPLNEMEISAKQQQIVNKFYRLLNCKEYDKRDKQVMLLTLQDVFDILAKYQQHLVVGCQTKLIKKLPEFE